ncbi:unnamed protein product, partial [Adineta steineri]
MLPAVTTSTCTFNVMHIYSSAGVATADTMLYPATCDSFCSGSFYSSSDAVNVIDAVTSNAGYGPTVSTTVPMMGNSCVFSYGTATANDHQFFISNTITSAYPTLISGTPCDSPYGTSYCCCTPNSGWSRTGDMHHVRYVHKAVLLHNKNVFVIGGADSVGLNRINNILRSAELYDPS